MKRFVIYEDRTGDISQWKRGPSNPDFTAPGYSVLEVSESDFALHENRGTLSQRFHVSAGVLSERPEWAAEKQAGADESARIILNGKLQALDEVILRHIEQSALLAIGGITAPKLTDQEYLAVLAYKQELRDLQWRGVPRDQLSIPNLPAELAAKLNK